MSDTSQGPGWWQASDDKWYPPESHPDYQPAASQQSTPPNPQPTSGYPSTHQPTPPSQAAPPGDYHQPQQTSPQMYSPSPPAAAPTQQYAPGQQYSAGQQYATGQQYPGQQYAGAPQSYAPMPNSNQPWWKKNWWIFAVAAGTAVLAIGMVAVLSRGGGGESAPTTTVEEEKEKTTKTTVEEEEEEEEETPDTTRPEPTTTPAPTTEAAPSTTTATLFTEEDVRTILFPVIFASYRTSIEDALNQNPDVKSVDRLDYEPGPGTVFMTLTLENSDPDITRDANWQLTQRMSQLWTTDDWVNPDNGWSPSFSLTIADTEYKCSGKQMQKIQDGSWDQDKWEEKCRVR